MSLLRPAAGGESCQQDSFLPYRKVRRQKDIDYEVSKTLFYLIGFWCGKVCQTIPAGQGFDGRGV